MEEIQLRKCTKCLKELDFSNFSKKKGGLYGLRSACKSCDLEYGRQYIKLNEEKVKERKRLYNINNFEKNKEYRIKNKDIIKEKKSLYQKSPHGKMIFLVNRQKRRTRKQNVFNDGSITKQALDNMLVNQNYKCGYCSIDINVGNAHLDHINPISKGGSHTIDNVHFTCSYCNLSKGAKTHEEFLKLINK